MRVAKADGARRSSTPTTPTASACRRRSRRPPVQSVVTNYLVDTSGSLSHVVAETDGVGALKAYYVRGDDLLERHAPAPVPRLADALRPRRRHRLHPPADRRGRHHHRRLHLHRLRRTHRPHGHRPPALRLRGRALRPEHRLPVPPGPVDGSGRGSLRGDGSVARLAIRARLAPSVPVWFRQSGDKHRSHRATGLQPRFTDDGPHDSRSVVEHGGSELEPAPLLRHGRPRRAADHSSPDSNEPLWTLPGPSPRGWGGRWPCPGGVGSGERRSANSGCSKNQSDRLRRDRSRPGPRRLRCAPFEEWHPHRRLGAARQRRQCQGERYR